MVGTSSYDHAVFLVRKGKDDIALEFKQNIIHRNCPVILAYLNLVIYRKTPCPWPFLIHISKIAERNILVPGCDLDQFFIIKTDFKFFCESLADRTSTASIHSIDCDNTFTHIASSFRGLLFTPFAVTFNFFL